MRPTLVLGLRRTLPLSLRPTLRARAGAATGDGGLTRGARRDPELIPLGLIMMGIFGVAGYFGGIKIWSRGTEREQESEKVLLGKWQGAYIREVEHGVKGTESRAAEEYR